MSHINASQLQKAGKTSSLCFCLVFFLFPPYVLVWLFFFIYNFLLFLLLFSCSSNDYFSVYDQETAAKFEKPKFLHDFLKLQKHFFDENNDSLCKRKCQTPWDWMGIKLHFSVTKVTQFQKQRQVVFGSACILSGYSGQNMNALNYACQVCP